MDRQQILELDAVLSQILCLKDSYFSKFINSDATKPFITRIQLFWSMTSVLEVDELSFGLHEKILKFLLRLCPSFNNKIPKAQPQDRDKEKDNSSNLVVLRAVICPKKFLESLFDPDPLGLLTYLYSTWNPSEYLEIIRDDLIPDSLVKHLSKQLGNCSNEQTRKFLKWVTKNSSHQGPIKSIEKESILRRFEYESDDDYFEDDEEGNSNSNENISMDPIQVILLSNYISSPSSFSRTATARKSPHRLAILKEAKLSHEQLEGWALMLERNPKKSSVIQDFIIWQKLKSNQ